MVTYILKWSSSLDFWSKFGRQLYWKSSLVTVQTYLLKWMFRVKMCLWKHYETFELLIQTKDTFVSIHTLIKNSSLRLIRGVFSVRRYFIVFGQLASCLVMDKLFRTSCGNIKAKYEMAGKLQREPPQYHIVRWLLDFCEISPEAFTHCITGR